MSPGLGELSSSMRQTHRKKHESMRLRSDINIHMHVHVYIHIYIYVCVTCIRIHCLREKTHIGPSTRKDTPPGHTQNKAGTRLLIPDLVKVEQSKWQPLTLKLTIMGCQTSCRPPSSDYDGLGQKLLQNAAQKLERMLAICARALFGRSLLAAGSL